MFARRTKLLLLKSKCQGLARNTVVQCRPILHQQVQVVNQRQIGCFSSNDSWLPMKGLVDCFDSWTADRCVPNLGNESLKVRNIFVLHSFVSYKLHWCKLRQKLCVVLLAFNDPCASSSTRKSGAWQKRKPANTSPPPSFSAARGNESCTCRHHCHRRLSRGTTTRWARAAFTLSQRVLAMGELSMCTGGRRAQPKGVPPLTKFWIRASYQFWKNCEFSLTLG